MCAALLIVRTLSVEDYALYTVFLTGYALLCSVTDLGLPGTLAFFASKFGSKNIDPFLGAVRELRRYSYGVGVLVTFIFVIYATKNVQLTQLTTPELLGALLLAGWFGSKIQLTGFVLRLQARFRDSYIPDLAAETAKFALVLLVFWSFPSLWSALLATIAGLLIGSRVGDWKAREAGVTQVKSHTHEHRLSVFRQVWPSVPSTIYVMASQVLLVPSLAVTFATPESLAEIGALTRLVLIALVAGGFVSHVITPLLTSIADERAFWKLGLRWIVFLVCGCGLVIAAGYWFADSVLWLLGPSYLHLGSELSVMLLGAAGTLLGAFLWELNRSRGLVRKQYFEVLWSGLVLAIVISTVNLTTTMGLVCVSVSGALSAAAFQFFIATPHAWRCLR